MTDIHSMQKCGACGDYGMGFHEHHLDGRAYGTATVRLCVGCHVALHEVASKLLARSDKALMRLMVRFVYSQMLVRAGAES